MKIIRIFGENLFSIKYPKEEIDEFTRLFQVWYDVECLEDFFESNIEDLQTDFWEGLSVEAAINNTIKYATELESKFLTLSKRPIESHLLGFGELFRPLNDNEPQVEILSKSKARETWLRIYALRVDRDVYVVTGGAIKLTRSMAERDHTDRELRKLERSRDFLMERGIIDIDGLVEEIEI